MHLQCFILCYMNFLGTMSVNHPCDNTTSWYIATLRQCYEKGQNAFLKYLSCRSHFDQLQIRF